MYRDTLMRVGLVVAAVALAMLGLMVLDGFDPPGRHPKPAPKPQPKPAPKPDPFDAVARELLRLHNQERARHRYPPLVLSEQLCLAARRHAQHMAQTGRMEHVGIGDFDPGSRIRDAGYRFVKAGENIAEGYRDEASVVRGWMSDWGHRWNILGRYQHLGAAVAYDRQGAPYWCCDFGTPGGTGTGSVSMGAFPLETGP